jgi:hypothetical protein
LHLCEARYSLSVARTKFPNSPKLLLLYDIPLYLAKWLHSFTHVFCYSFFLQLGGKRDSFCVCHSLRNSGAQAIDLAFKSCKGFWLQILWCNGEGNSCMCRKVAGLYTTVNPGNNTMETSKGQKTALLVRIATILKFQYLSNLTKMCIFLTRLILWILTTARNGYIRAQVRHRQWIFSLVNSISL